MRIVEYRFKDGFASIFSLSRNIISSKYGNHGPHQIWR